MNIRSNINIIFGTDEALTARFSEILAPEGYNLFTCSDSELNEAAMNGFPAKLVILCMTGFGAIENIRNESTVPILYIAERADEFTTIMALSKGADAVVPADVGRIEFAARVKALIRRGGLFCHIPSYSGDNVFVKGGITLDCGSREVTVNGRPVKTTKLEFGILEYLMRNSGKICSAENIYSSVWKNTSYDVRKTVVEHIRRLRAKIEPDPKNPQYIKVVFGAGYIFTESSGNAASSVLTA